MTSSIAYPADPVTQGATLIQSTTFANVAADYQKIDWATAYRYMTGKGYPVRDFPKSKEPDPNWVFYIRKDLSGGSATDRNLIGIRVSQLSIKTTVFSVAAGGNLVVPLNEWNVQVINWAPYRTTLTTGEIYTRFVPYSASVVLPSDPETGNLLYDTTTYRLLEEAVGMILLRSAAAAPTLDPVTNLIGGGDPIS